MIEIMQQTEDKVKLPKNIRQIGNPVDNWKIYVEDYVYTYLHPTIEEEKKNKKICILLGKVERAEKNYIFISGAVAVEPLQEVTLLPEFTEEVWEYIYKQTKQYFDDLEIVGWSVMTSFWPLRLLSEFENIHRRHFEGNDKVMFLMNPDELEEKFYRIQNGNLSGQAGYYIYYEKNEPMQNFMVQQYQKSPTEEETETVSEGAISNYRAMIKENQVHVQSKAEHSIWCAAGVLTAMAACVIGISAINNYEKMANMQNAIQVLSESVETETTEQSAQSVKIQDVESNIKPLTNTGETAQSGQAADNLGQAETQTVAPAQQQQEAPAANNTQQTEGNAQPLTEAQTYQMQGYYVVQQGDSLASISQKIYQNTNMVAQICQKNGIADENTIYVGQKLLLP